MRITDFNQIDPKKEYWISFSSTSEPELFRVDSFSNTGIVFSRGRGRGVKRHVIKRELKTVYNRLVDHDGPYAPAVFSTKEEADRIFNSLSKEDFQSSGWNSFQV